MSFVDSSQSPGEDGDIQFDVPEVKALPGLFAVVKTDPVSLTGDTPTSMDFPICAEGTSAARAYEISFGDANDESISRIYYTPTLGAGSKRGASSGRLDYYSLKHLRC